MVNLGSSTYSNAKTVAVGARGRLVCPRTVSIRNWISTSSSKWPDAFKVTVSGNKVTVTRTDSKGGWGMNLKFMCKSMGVAVRGKVVASTATGLRLCGTRQSTASSRVGALEPVGAARPPSGAGAGTVRTTTGWAKHASPVEVARCIPDVGAEKVFANRGYRFSGMGDLTGARPVYYLGGRSTVSPGPRDIPLVTDKDATVYIDLPAGERFEDVVYTFGEEDGLCSPGLVPVPEGECAQAAKATLGGEDYAFMHGGGCGDAWDAKKYPNTKEANLTSCASTCRETGNCTHFVYTSASGTCKRHNRCTKKAEADAPSSYALLRGGLDLNITRTSSPATPLGCSFRRDDWSLEWNAGALQNESTPAARSRFTVLCKARAHVPGSSQTLPAWLGDANNGWRKLDGFAGTTLGSGSSVGSSATCGQRIVMANKVCTAVAFTERTSLQECAAACAKDVRCTRFAYAGHSSVGEAGDTCVGCQTTGAGAVAHDTDFDIFEPDAGAPKTCPYTGRGVFAKSFAAGATINLAHPTGSDHPLVMFIDYNGTTPVKADKVATHPRPAERVEYNVVTDEMAMCAKATGSNVKYIGETCGCDKKKIRWTGMETDDSRFHGCTWTLRDGYASAGYATGYRYPPPYHTHTHT